MLKTSLASLAIAAALLGFTPGFSATHAEAGSLRKAAKIGAVVIVSGLVIRCGVRTLKGRSCL